MAELSLPRGHIGAVSVAGVAVFAAGRTASGRTQVVDYFDIATGLWTSSQIPGSVPRDDMVAASAGSLAFFTKGSFCRIVLCMMVFHILLSLQRIRHHRVRF